MTLDTMQKLAATTLRTEVSSPDVNVLYKRLLSSSFCSSHISP